LEEAEEQWNVVNIGEGVVTEEEENPGG